MIKGQIHVKKIFSKQEYSFSLYGHQWNRVYSTYITASAVFERYNSSAIAELCVIATGTFDTRRQTRVKIMKICGERTNDFAGSDKGEVSWKAQTGNWQHLFPKLDTIIRCKVQKARYNNERSRTTTALCWFFSSFLVFSTDQELRSRVGDENFAKDVKPFRIRRSFVDDPAIIIPKPPNFLSPSPLNTRPRST